MIPRSAAITLAAAAALAVLGLLFVRVCADGGAMGSPYQTCECAGFEWELYDRLAADGPRRTLCVGLLESRTCQQFRDGPVRECPE